MRFSKHCYSFEHDGGEYPEGSYIFEDRHQTRVFCPVRHACSLDLPSMFRGICVKPTSTVYLTAEKNWTFSLATAIELPAGEKFWIFFHVERTAGKKGLPTEVDLFVESAYPRPQKPAIARGTPFGKVLEKL